MPVKKLINFHFLLSINFHLYYTHLDNVTNHHRQHGERESQNIEESKRNESCTTVQNILLINKYEGGKRYQGHLSENKNQAINIYLFSNDLETSYKLLLTKNGAQDQIKLVPALRYAASLRTLISLFLIFKICSSKEGSQA